MQVFQTPCKHQTHFTTPLCMQLLNNATHLKTQIQPYNDFACKKERLTLWQQVGFLSWCLCAPSLLFYSHNQDKIQFWSHISCHFIPLTVVYPVQTQITALRGCLQAKIHCTPLQILRYYLDPMHNSASNLNTQRTILTHNKNEC